MSDAWMFRWDCPKDGCGWWREVPGLGLDALWGYVDVHRTEHEHFTEEPA